MLSQVAILNLALFFSYVVDLDNGECWVIRNRIVSKWPVESQSGLILDHPQVRGQECGQSQLVQVKALLGIFYLISIEKIES